MTRAATADRESRLRRSLRRLGYDLVDAERGNVHIPRQGSKINETADLFGLDLTGVETWIRDRRTGYDQQRRQQGASSDSQ
jgi:hypothetical protein